MKIVFSQHDIFCTFKHWSNTIFRASSLTKVGPLTKTLKLLALLEMLQG